MESRPQFANASSHWNGSKLWHWSFTQLSSGCETLSSSLSVSKVIFQPGVPPGLSGQLHTGPSLHVNCQASPSSSMMLTLPLSSSPRLAPTIHFRAGWSDFSELETSRHLCSPDGSFPIAAQLSRLSQSPDTIGLIGRIRTLLSSFVLTVILADAQYTSNPGSYPIASLTPLLHFRR